MRTSFGHPAPEDGTASAAHLGAPRGASLAVRPGLAVASTGMTSNGGLAHEATRGCHGGGRPPRGVWLRGHVAGSIHPRRVDGSRRGQPGDGRRERADRHLVRQHPRTGPRGLEEGAPGSGRPRVRRGRRPVADPGQDRPCQQRGQGLAGPRVQRRQPDRHDGDPAERLGDGPDAVREQGAARPV